VTCGVLYYDGFAEFEIVIALGTFARRAQIVPVALEKRPYLSEEQQTFLPARLVRSLDPTQVDVFLIPGGDPTTIMDDPDIARLLVALHQRSRIIGAICGGVALLGHLGLLQGRRFTGAARGHEIDAAALATRFKDAHYTGEGVTVDGHIVTAQGQAFVEFALEVARLAGVYGSEEERLRDYRWLKNQ
jgi:4-methyl-5(b-hydroxyethyl)-thiazole monophosphate biosynthesis